MRLSCEILMYFEVYKEKKDVRVIMYIYLLYVIIFVVVNKGILLVVVDVRYYGGYIYVVFYEKV